MVSGRFSPFRWRDPYGLPSYASAHAGAFCLWPVGEQPHGPIRPDQSVISYGLHPERQNLSNRRDSSVFAFGLSAWSLVVPGFPCATYDLRPDTFGTCESY